MKKLGGLDWVALILVVIGAVNWGLVGLFSWDLVATLFGGMSAIARVIYVVVGLAGLYTLLMALKSGKSASVGGGM